MVGIITGMTMAAVGLFGKMVQTVAQFSILGVFGTCIFAMLVYMIQDVLR